MGSRLLRSAQLLALASLIFSSDLAAGQFTPFSSDRKNILEGNWQSCAEPDGAYSERVYDHVVNGVGRFEVHMGPRLEFAIFKGVQDEHREHSSAANLLKPFQVPLDGLRAHQKWEIPSLKLMFTVELGGGSRTECDSWFITLSPLTTNVSD